MNRNIVKFLVIFISLVLAHEFLTGDSMASRSENMAKNLKGWHPERQLEKSDPEFSAIRDKLVYGEIINSGSLNTGQQAMAGLAALIATQTLDSIQNQVEMALHFGVKPVAIKEVCYQCAPYVGIPRVEAALVIVNRVFAAHHIELPLPRQGTVKEDTRLQAGMDTQKKIFGSKGIEKMQESAPQGQKEIVVNYLSAYCFGDFYTRSGLDLKMRELITFSAIVSLGGCDPQAQAHAKANISVGNTKQNLVDTLAVLLPFIGFPRTLNGLAAVNAAVPE